MKIRLLLLMALLAAPISSFADRYYWQDLDGFVLSLILETYDESISWEEVNWTCPSYDKLKKYPQTILSYIDMVEGSIIVNLMPEKRDSYHPKVSIAYKLSNCGPRFISVTYRDFKFRHLVIETTYFSAETGEMTSKNQTPLPEDKLRRLFWLFR